MLLYGGNPNDLKKSDPYTLNFGSTPVAAGGAQIESNYDGKFTAEVQAMDASGNVLASFTENGNATQAANNSAIFIGISSTSANIYQIALSLTRAPSNTIGEFAINQFDFRAGAAPTAASVRQLASAVGRHPLASSLLNTGQPALPAAPPPGQATPTAPPAGQSGMLPAASASSPVPAWTTDAVFTESRMAANDDVAWRFARLFSGIVRNNVAPLGADLDILGAAALNDSSVGVIYS
jgi:hypothetical protein